MENYYEKTTKKNYDDDEISQLRAVGDFSWEKTYKYLHNKISFYLEDAMVLNEFVENSKNIKAKMRKLMEYFVSEKKDLDFVLFGVDSSEGLAVNFTFNFYFGTIVSSEEKAALLVDFETLLSSQ